MYPTKVSEPCKDQPQNTGVTKHCNSATRKLFLDSKLSKAEISVGSQNFFELLMSISFNSLKIMVCMSDFLYQIFLSQFKYKQAPSTAQKALFIDRNLDKL